MAIRKLAETNGARGVVGARFARPVEGIKDAELLRRFATGHEEQAFAALVRRHGPLVHSVCRRLLHDPQEAEDAFQATFLVLACKAQNIRKLDSVASWLFGVASRLCGKLRCQAARRRFHERQASTDPIAARSPDDLSWRETCLALHAEVNRLPDKQRAPVLLCYWEGLSQNDAAEQLGIPRGTLKRRLEDGRERLRERLARRGIMLSAVLLAMMLGQSDAWAAVEPRLVAQMVRSARGTRTAAGAMGHCVSPNAALLATRLLRGFVALKFKTALVCLLAGTCVAVAVADPLAIAKPIPERAETAAPSVPAPPPMSLPAVEPYPAHASPQTSNAVPEDSAPGDIAVQPAWIARPKPHHVM